MRRFLRKQVPAFLLTLAMVAAMVPMASARSSADIEYDVDAGENVTLELSDFEAYYDDNENDILRRMEFTRADGMDSYGKMYAIDADGDEVRVDEDDLLDGWFYASRNNVTDSGEYRIKGMNYTASSSADGETVELEFTMRGDDGGKLTGTLRINIGSSPEDNITYTVKPGGETSLDASDFEQYYTDRCSGSFKYVTFSVPSGSYSDFSGYVTLRDNSLKRSDLTGNKFYYDDSAYGDLPLKRLGVAADTSASNDSLDIRFTVYGENNSGSKTYSAEGIMTLEVSKSGSSSSKGTISYTVKAGEETAFDEDDFKKVYDDSSCTGTFKYVIFDRPSSTDYANGTLYSRYGKRNETSFSRAGLVDTKFYYSSSFDGYNLDELSFVADKSFTSGSIALSFTAYGGTGSKDNQSVNGTLKIISGKSGSSTAKGDVAYTVKAGSAVSFDEDDFEAVYDNSCSGTFKYLTFTRPGSDYDGAGAIYSRYGNRKETSFSRSQLSSTSFGFDDYEDAEYSLSDLSFVADNSFSGSITLKFTAYGGAGSRTNQSVDGTLVITTGSSGSKSYYVGNIRYTTTPGTPLQLNANDFARFFKKYSSGSLAYVTLTGVPATGSLYYNYYGASQYGITARTQLTVSSAAGKVFSYSPATTAEYALSELTYVPSGTNYCTAVSFTAHGSSGQNVSGTILISVNSSAVPEIYSVTTKGTSVTFPASSVSAAVASAAGSGLSGIQLLDLPGTTAGVLYAGSVAANVTTQYSYADMSQLRFIPNSGFTGSVTIPYVALNSSGTAIAAGQFSIGVVNSVKKFSDVSTSTWCYKYVTELSGANIISGYSNGSFQEKNTITYGAALKLVMLAAGYAEQAPTVKGSTFSGYLSKAKADGLVTGNPKLNGSITRLQIAQIAAKALELSTAGLSNKKPFTDTNDVYVQALNAAGIIEGYFSNGTSTYKPNNTLTRGQVSAIVWRMQNYKK